MALDRRLEGWYAAWGWLAFARPTLLAQVAVVLLGLAFFALELGRERYNPLRAGDSYLLGAALLWLLGGAATVVHELAHALAVKHARRGVYRAGVMLYFGMPTPFVDTSDIWMAGRRQRLAASFAGPWAELVLGATCAALACALPEGPLGAALFTWAFACLVQTAFQFFPLLELDGYYLLIDLLDQPRLRPRSLAYVRGPLWADLGRRLRTGERFTPEQHLLAWFGLGSAAASLLACVLAAVTWQHWLGPLFAEAWGLAAGAARAAGVAS